MSSSRPNSTRLITERCPSASWSAPETFNLRREKWLCVRESHHLRYIDFLPPRAGLVGSVWDILIDCIAHGTLQIAAVAANVLPFSRSFPFPMMCLLVILITGKMKGGSNACLVPKSLCWSALKCKKEIGFSLEL